jgi:hypothetical protein
MNPYITGSFVGGAQFYGRLGLVTQLLTSKDRATWVMGNRRIGKTSLFRRLEEIGNNDTQVVFMIDLQSAGTPESMRSRFADDLADEFDEKLARFGLTTQDLLERTPDQLLNLLDKKAREKNLDVLVLLDEAEVLVDLAGIPEGNELLKRIQRELQVSQRLRVVFSANRQLLKLHELCKDWPTSQILQSVALRYMGHLGRSDALALIRQTQSSTPLQVEDAVAEAILAATGGHPALTQLLCDRLWSEQGLRAPAIPDDLMPDPLLDSFFRIDHLCLSPVEISILKVLSVVESLDEARLGEVIEPKLPPLRLRFVLGPLVELGYVRKAATGYMIGNQFLATWLQVADVDALRPEVSNEAVVDQVDPEIQMVRQIIEELTRRMRQRELQQAQLGISVDPSIPNEIAELKQEIAAKTAEIEQIRTRRLAEAVAARTV